LSRFVRLIAIVFSWLTVASVSHSTWCRRWKWQKQNLRMWLSTTTTRKVVLLMV